MGILGSIRGPSPGPMGVYPELVGIGLVATVKGHDGRLPTQKQVRAVQAVLNVVASILVLSPIRFRLDATITLDEAEGFEGDDS